MNRHAPLKQLNLKEIKLSHKPWISDTIRQKIKQRNKLFARRKREPNNNIVNNAYKRFRNTVKRDISKAKKKYYAEYFSSCKNDMKKLWKGIRNIINSRNTAIKTSQINLDNKVIDDPL